MTGRVARWTVALAAALLARPALPQAGAPQPGPHTQAAPLFSTANPQEAAFWADLGTQIERDRAPRDALAEHRRLAATLAGLQPGRPGVPDAFVVAVALDSDPVFSREAREAGRVLARRYGAGPGRTLVLAGPDGRGGAALPMGSPESLGLALARVAELAAADEDVLVLYTTSHGAPWGIVYDDADQGFGAISPSRLWTMLGSLGLTRRVLLVSACYSGAFVPMLQGEDTAIVTASAADRTSFGCQADSDWTFFGDALVNQALRKPQPLAAAAAEAQRAIAGWEGEAKLTPSQPQVSVGAGAARWLPALEAHLPAATAPVGRPARSALATLGTR
jgi:hypothetical protein